MRKIFIFFLMTTLVVIFGCAKNNSEGVKTQPVFMEKFSADIQADYDEEVLKGKMDYLKDGYCQVEIDEPKVLSGMVLLITSDECKITFKGLTYEIDQEDVPQVSFAYSVKRALDCISQNEGLSKTEKDGDTIYKGTAENESFEMTVDENGNYKTLSIPSNNTTVTFNNFVVS